MRNLTERQIDVAPDFIDVRSIHLMQHHSEASSVYGTREYILVIEASEEWPAGIQSSSLGFRCSREELVKVAQQILQAYGSP